MHEKHRHESELARQQQAFCFVWLREIIGLPGPKSFTKAELRSEAIRRWSVFKNAFDYAWIDMIEEPGWQDWYAPIRRGEKRSRNLDRGHERQEVRQISGSRRKVG